MKIQDVMTRDPSCVTPDTPARDAARLMRDEDIGIVPVVDGDGKQLVGVVTDRDIALRVVGEGRESDTRIRDVMSRDTLATCRSDGDLNEVMDLMAQEQVRRVPIVDERGSLVGIVSQADVVRANNDGKAERTVKEISQPGGQHSQ